MTWDLYLAFVPVTLAILLIPGPTLALIAVNTATRGRRSGLQTVCGVAAGKALIVLCLIGLLTSTLAFVETYGTSIRWVGALYILAAAVRAWRSTGQALEETKHREGRKAGAFMQGFVAASTSPITLLFLATQMPSFVDSGLPAAPQLAILGGSYMVAALAVELTVVSFVVASSKWKGVSRAGQLGAKGSAVCLFGVAALVSPLSAGVLV
ncbi:MAG: LysE family translocator [Pseudomonadota bacterium]